MSEQREVPPEDDRGPGELDDAADSADSGKSIRPQARSVTRAADGIIVHVEILGAGDDRPPT
jgi:hypothetical protein